MARVVGLDMSLIVKAALAIADREGLDKLTMRGLSRELGVTPMATYHYVSGKEELVDLVIDESIGQLPLADPDGDPLAELVGWFVALYEQLMDHPALAQAMAGRRLEGELATASARALTLCALRSGLDVEAAVELVINGFGFTLGSGLLSTSRQTAHAERGDRALAGEDDPLVAVLASARTESTQFRNGLEHLLRSYVG